MTFINLLGIIFFIVIMIVGVTLRFITRKRLKNIDGFGGKYKKKDKKGNLISKG